MSSSNKKLVVDPSKFTLKDWDLIKRYLVTNVNHDPDLQHLTFDMLEAINDTNFVHTAKGLGKGKVEKMCEKLQQIQNLSSSSEELF